MVEMCIELVSDFEYVVATLPDEMNTSTLSEVPPLLACGDHSVVSNALDMLQVLLEYSVVFHDERLVVFSRSVCLSYKLFLVSLC